jgi:hypothetical protein
MVAQPNDLRVIQPQRTIGSIAFLLGEMQVRYHGFRPVEFDALHHPDIGLLLPGR